MREATVSIDEGAFEAMGIEDFVELGRAAGMRSFEELTCHGTGAVVQVTVERRYDEDALEALAYVDSWEHVAATDEGHCYVIAFSAPKLPESVAEAADELVGPCDPDIGERAATMSLVGDQSAIARTLEAYEAAGVSPGLERLGAYHGGTSPLDELTDRQREVLETALELGYFDVPRSATTTDVAAALDLDRSTVTEHLQRAERAVFERLL